MVGVWFGNRINCGDKTFLVCSSEPTFQINLFGNHTRAKTGVQYHTMFEDHSAQFYTVAQTFRTTDEN